MYRRRGLTSRATRATLVLTIFSFTFATLSWASWVASYATLIRAVLVQNVGMELKKKLALGTKSKLTPIILPLGGFQVP